MSDIKSTSIGMRAGDISKCNSCFTEHRIASLKIMIATEIWRA